MPLPQYGRSPVRAGFSTSWNQHQFFDRNLCVDISNALAAKYGTNVIKNATTVNANRQAEYVWKLPDTSLYFRLLLTENNANSPSMVTTQCLRFSVGDGYDNTNLTNEVVLNQTMKVDGTVGTSLNTRFIWYLSDWGFWMGFTRLSSYYTMNGHEIHVADLTQSWSSYCFVGASLTVDSATGLVDPTTVMAFITDFSRDGPPTEQHLAYLYGLNTRMTEYSLAKKTTSPVATGNWPIMNFNPVTVASSSPDERYSVSCYSPFAPYRELTMFRAVPNGQIAAGNIAEGQLLVESNNSRYWVAHRTDVFWQNIARFHPTEIFGNSFLALRWE